MKKDITQPTINNNPANHLEVNLLTSSGDIKIGEQIIDQQEKIEKAKHSGENEKVVTTHETMAEGGHEPTLYAEHLFDLGPLPVTNSLLAGWLVTIVLVILGFILRKNIKQIPGKLQSVFEVFLEGALDLGDQVTGDRKLSIKIVPIAGTIFLMVLVNNWLGLLPGFGSIGFMANEEGHSVFVPFLRGGTADLNFTLAFALMAVIGSNIFGVVSIGAWKTFNKFVNIKALASIPGKIRKDPTVIIISPITFFVGLIEIVGEIAKVASLSFRLFGNVFAGEVLLASMTSLVPYVVPIPFYLMEVLVGFIQALIFAMLTLVYFTIATHDHDDHDEEHNSEEKKEAKKEGNSQTPELAGVS